MRKINKFVTILGLVLGVAGSASAQTCAAPGIFNFGNPNAPSASGDTCAGTSFFGDICDDTFPSPSPDAIYSLNINSAGTNGYTSQSISLTTGAAAFNPVIALLGPNVACASATPCLRSASSGGVGAGETVNAGGLANGQYFVLVSGDPGSNTCGTFTLAANGSLPVQLQNFAVE